MDVLTALGLIAGALTTLGFVPQVVKTWRTKSGHDLSFGMFGALLLGAALWLAYGILREDAPLIAANSVALVLQFVVVGLMIRYRHADRPSPRHELPTRERLYAPPVEQQGDGAHQAAVPSVTRTPESPRP